MSGSTNKTGASGAQTITRAIRALKLMTGHVAQGIRLVDLAEQMNLERPTAHRLLKALAAEGVVIQQPGTRRYTLGPMLFELGLAAAHQFNLQDSCRPILMRLAEETGDTSFLFVRSGNDAVCLCRVQGGFPIQTPAVPVGSRQPLGISAGGLALLSALCDEEIASIMDAVEPRLAVYGCLTRNEVLQYCEQVRKLGYALISNRAVPGVGAVGLPIISQTGVPVAAVTVAAIQSRMSTERVGSILPLLEKARNEITALLSP